MTYWSENQVHDGQPWLHGHLISYEQASLSGIFSIPGAINAAQVPITDGMTLPQSHGYACCDLPIAAFHKLHMTTFLTTDTSNTIVSAGSYECIAGSVILEYGPTV